MPTKVLLLENIHPGAVRELETRGYAVELRTGALPEDELNKLLPHVDVLGIRSKTHLSRAVLDRHQHLRAIGAFCIGTNQIDLEAARRAGTPVFNAPYSNTRSVAELVLAEMVALSRNLGDVNAAAHRGEWIKSAKGVHEVRGKTLGIVGYGHIGSQVSVLAEALGLRVIYHDVIKKLPLGNARPTESLDEVLTQSDFVTLHVPETPQTKNMIGASQLARMPARACLINASRGTVVDIPALAKAIRTKALAGAAIDVFPHEPENNEQPFESELQGLRNVILTPHVGGSTEEAQEAIGLEVAHALVSFLETGLTLGAVNFPLLNVPPRDPDLVRLINVHRNVPGVLGQINSIVSAAGGNVRAQYLATDPVIGHLVIDIEGAAAERLHDPVASLATSIQTRALGPE